MADVGGGQAKDRPRSRLRIRLSAIAIVLAAALILGCVWWFAIVPVHRPTLDRGAGEVHAIDVSNHQGVIDWNAVADDGIGAAMIKATEGDDYVDPRFGENWKQVSATSIRRGAYHFFTLCSSGADQAANFLRAAPPDQRALAPAVDLELIGACTRRPPQSEVDEELGDFRRIVEAAWERPLLVYARGSFTSKYSIGSLADRPQWVTHFFVRPPADEWTVWQIHYFARVDGIDGKVDLDVLRLG
ncbi:MAG: GH25 family lysozyme [Brevibacterium sp.]